MKNHEISLAVYDREDAGLVILNINESSLKNGYRI